MSRIEQAKDKFHELLELSSDELTQRLAAELPRIQAATLIAAYDRLEAGYVPDPIFAEISIAASLIAIRHELHDLSHSLGMICDHQAEIAASAIDANVRSERIQSRALELLVEIRSELANGSNAIGVIADRG